jgi:hypothetical protein
MASDLDAAKCTFSRTALSGATWPLCKVTESRLIHVLGSKSISRRDLTVPKKLMFPRLQRDSTLRLGAPIAFLVEKASQFHFAFEVERTLTFEFDSVSDESALEFSSPGRGLKGAQRGLAQPF